MTHCLCPGQECSQAMPPGQRATYRSLGEPQCVYSNVHTSYLLTLWMKAVTESPVPTKDFQRKEFCVKTWKVLNEMSCWVWNTLLKERWSGAEGRLHWWKLVDSFSSYIWVVKKSPQPKAAGCGPRVTTVTAQTRRKRGLQKSPEGLRLPAARLLL